jgi:predicted transcriptional regulator
MNKLLSVILALILASCSVWQTERHYGYFPHGKRLPASNVDMSRLEELLAVDKFDYYVGEYINSFGKKIDEESVKKLKKVDAKFIMQRFGNDVRLYDAQKYDEIIYEIVKEGRSSLPLKKAEYKWGYNFFKNKLNGGFALLDTKLKTEDNTALTAKAADVTEQLQDIPFKPSDLTLDAAHYISNRTTRAVFWEAVESGRDIEFHLENSREFLKNLSDNGAHVVKEVRPFANNYNKIYVVQYPGEDTYRYAITSIGGKDRLEHLLMQFGLSNLNGQEIKNKVRIFGDLDVRHKMMEDELTGIMKHMPQAKRTIIGQKGAIERTLDLLWKVRALSNLYETDADSVLSLFPEKDRDDVKRFLQTEDYKEYDIFKNKKKLEGAFDSVKAVIEEKGLTPEEFKMYDYDNYVISMSDFIFKNKQGEDVVWRVVANSWGDEIAPLARALKNTGHHHITYIGTAGAFPDKGYKVGDLAIPTHAYVDGGNKKLYGEALDIDGAKVGGSVDHVYSPFVETFDWLEEAQSHSDFVEVETSHLRKILNKNDIEMRAYLLISDVLTNEGETLASASSAKRRNALNKLLYGMLERDDVGIPKGTQVNYTGASKLRELVEKAIPKKANSFKYYVISALRDSDINSVDEVLSFVDSVDNFSDKYFTDRLVKTSELTSFMARAIEAEDTLPKIAISKDFVDGKWHPKNGKIKVNFYANSDADLEKMKAIAAKYEDETDKISKYAEIQFVRGPPTEDFVTVPKFTSKDSDFLVQLYSQSAFKQAGLDAQVTYNGNVKYNFLPTTETTQVCNDGKFCHLAFFSPDNATKNALVNIDTNDKVLNLTGLNAREMFESKVTNLKSRLVASGQREDYVATIKVNKSATFSDGKMAEITPSFEEGKGLVINVNFSAEGWKNPLVVLEEMVHLEQIVKSNSYFKSPIFWAEMALNAEYGSQRSRKFMAEAEVHAMDSLENIFNEGYQQSSEVTDYINARRDHAKKIVKDLAKKERAEKKFRKGVTARWKTLQKELEAQNLKLDDYIASNNRKKVAELIDAYMPWENMEPTEIAAWTRWLDAIEKPSNNAADYNITFRGVSSDLVRQSDDGGHFLMAKMLTKNQGNYTRRLRSLKTFFKKKLSAKANGEIPVEVQSLAGIFKGHSHEPMGSPFLSTSVYDVAENFAGYDPRKIAAMKIDQRRNLINLVSDYHELEQMVPLIVFPDEIIHMSEGQNMEEITEAVEGIIGRPLKSHELSKGENIKLSSTKEWWDMINPKGITSTKAKKTCKDVIKYFLSNK